MPERPRLGSLFTGYGGLDRAVEAVFGAELAWTSDIKPAACKLIEHYWPGTNLGDLTAIDWNSVEPVDIITGGFPCTDISTAGRQAGLIRYGDRTRSGLWAEMARAVDILRPSLVVAENVRAITSVKADSVVEPCSGCVGDPPDESALRALGAVLGDLADIGYDAAWHGLSASDVGAPHGRFRVFIIAWPADTHRARREADRTVAGATELTRTGRDRGAAAHTTDLGHQRGRGARGRRTESARLVGRPDAAQRGPGTPADTDSNPLWPKSIPERWRSGATLDRGDSAAAADTIGGGWRGRTQDAIGDPQRRAAAPGCGAVAWGPYEPAIRRWESIIGRPAPAPTEPGPRGGQRLSPRLTEWMMGLPDGWITTVPGLSRNDQLSLCGDGVVPQQAEAALRILLAHVTESGAA